MAMAAATAVEVEDGVADGPEQHEPTPLEAALLSRARPAAYASPFELEMAAARDQLGVGLINLASGDPDLPTPAHITAAAIAAIEGGHHHYTPKNGLPALREAISFHTERTIGMTYSLACDFPLVLLHFAAFCTRFTPFYSRFALFYSTFP